MSQLILSHAQRQLIDDEEFAPEVRDKSGRLIGYLVSPTKYVRMLEAREKMKQPKENES